MQSSLHSQFIAGVLLLQQGKQSNPGSSLPPQPGGKCLCLKLAKGETNQSCPADYSKAEADFLSLRFCMSLHRHCLTARQNLMCLSTAPWDTEERVPLSSFCFMDEEWSRDAKAHPDCLDSSHQRIPQWRKEPVTKYFSSMQRSPAALAKVPQ